MRKIAIVLPRVGDESTTVTFIIRRCEDIFITRTHGLENLFYDSFITLSAYKFQFIC